MSEWNGIDWVATSTLAYLAAFSVVAFFLTLFIVPWLIVRLPADYFINHKRKKLMWAEQHVILRYVLLVIKNIIGYIVIIAGIAMLVLPGQGLLSIFIGIMLIDFPRKFEFERWLITREPVLKVCNKLRRAAKKEDFSFEN